MSAYILASLQITDATVAFEEYRSRVPAVIAAYGGRYLVRGGGVLTYWKAMRARGTGW